MDFLELAKNRYSVRKFSAQPVEETKIDLILDAAKLAPTACNFQPHRLLVIKSKDALDKLKNCTPYHFDAPLAILICYDNQSSWKRNYDNADSGAVDASIVATQMMLEIANLGLGTTWVGHFDPVKMVETFNLPKNLVPVVLFPIGYPAETSVPHANHEKRFEKDKTVFYNTF